MTFNQSVSVSTWLAATWLVCSSPLSGLAMSEAPETPLPVSGHEVSAQSITPADVFARVQWIRKELDGLRFEMGEASSREVGLLVQEASPHEVFFQAKTLDQKVARLVGELTERPEPLEEERTPSDIRPLHVWRIVDRSLGRILFLKKELGVTFTNHETMPDLNTNPTQVFIAIGLANKQLNLLLSHQFSPKDVGEQVGLGMRYATKLLEGFSADTTEVPLPSLERGRTPWDAYSRLIDCYMVLGDIARASHIKMLTLDMHNLERPDIQPNDVYDLATLIISELAYLYSHQPNPISLEAEPLHGPILPSHVYQLAGGLLAQLHALEAQARAHPAALR
ncbi:hypothetical protein YTPLAS18_21070 [Nitrospira sp.]|nr:hypothetical protein YTPLAS18_21070 [Nitrospira sp.]